MRVGVTGANGMLGQDLVVVLRGRGHEVLAWAREDYDICDVTKVSAVVGETCPDLVVHAAAYTQVDKAENEPNVAHRVNGEGTRNMAMACRDRGIPMFYVSTDYIFDGTKGEPYMPGDAPNPINVYGHSKLLGEEAVRKLLEDYCIVRTSWLYGVHGQNFVYAILRLAQEKAELHVVNDQIGCPTWTGTLARALARLIEVKARGTCHVTDGCEGISWYDFAVAIVGMAGLTTEITPVSTVEFPRPARRPAYSVLSVSGTRPVLGYDFPAWTDSLRSMLTDVSAKKMTAEP